MFYCDLEMYGSDYILVMNTVKSYTEWYLYSKYHKDDFLASLGGDEVKHKILDVTDLYVDSCNDYLVEALRVNKMNKVYHFCYE